MLAKMLDKPVRLLWTREDDLTHDYYHAGCVHQFEAIVDRKRQLSAWTQRKASASALVGRGVADDRLWTSEASADAAACRPGAEFPQRLVRAAARPCRAARCAACRTSPMPSRPRASSTRSRT